MSTKNELNNKDKETLEQLISYLSCKEDVSNFKRKRGFVFNFALIWNLFEDQCMDNFARISEVDAFVENLIIQNNLTIVDEIYQYMSERYCQNSNYLYSRLLWRHSEQRIESFTESILQNPQSIAKERIKAVLYVIFRLRNNLFHGEKDIVTINAQQETFVLVNRFLMDIIKLYKSR